MTTKSEDRKNAVYRTAAGGSLFGAGAYANRHVERRLKNAGHEGLFDSAKKLKLKPAHASFLAGKIGARGLQVTGLPLVAVGVKHIVKPTSTKPFSLNDEIVKPVVRNTFLHDQVKRGEKSLNVNKDAALEQKIHSSRARARDLSLVGGTLGLAALGTRAPEVASAVARRSAKFSAKPKVKRLIAFEPKATKVSNALGIGAIGVGSTGSFNFAHLQNLQNKQDVKKDAFLDQYRNHISPKAEEGYKHLRRGAISRHVDSVGAGVLGTGMMAHSIRSVRHKNKPIAALELLGGALSNKTAYDTNRMAREWNAKANKIKAKAYERERNGELGPGRYTDMAKSMWVEKAALSLVPKVPKGMLRTPSIRQGHLMHTRSGKIVSVRGSVG